jgi:hypothetical protein
MAWNPECAFLVDSIGRRWKNSTSSKPHGTSKVMDLKTESPLRERKLAIRILGKADRLEGRQHQDGNRVHIGVLQERESQENSSVVKGRRPFLGKWNERKLIDKMSMQTPPKERKSKSEEIWSSRQMSQYDI